QEFLFYLDLDDDDNKYNSNTATVDQTPNQQTENIFMTEFENDDNYQNVIPMERPSPPEPTNVPQASVIPDDKFKGFEVFLDIENENEIAVPN
ncbi:unnamed protein product, partial [Rotaria socialis]